MPYFIYKVKDESGRTISGLLEADDKKEVKRKVGRGKYFFVDARTCNIKSVYNRKVKLQTLIMFTNRLSTMIEAGIPILTAMTILWRQTEDETIQLVVSHMRTHLEQGDKISNSMDNFPNIFPAVYRALIRVGETGGALTQILRKLCEYLEYKAKIIERFQRATLYPSIVIGFSLVVIVAMFYFIVPIFEKVLMKLNADLPPLTKVAMGISHMFRSPWFYLFIFLTIFGLIFLYRQMKRSKEVAAYVDGLIMKVPFFGNLITMMAISQFLRSLSILLAAGVPVIESLRVSNTTTGNKKIISDFEGIREDIEQGTTMYDAFKKVKSFPVMLSEMVGIGESTGMMVHVLERVNKQFDDEVDYKLNQFLTALEPALIIVVGGIVTFTLLSIYLPIVSVWKALGAR